MAKLDDLIKNLCPNGVEFLPIEKICIKISSGGTPKSSVKEFYNGKIFWLRTQEVNWNEINSTSMTITEEGLKNSSAKWIPKNCVIVAMYGATAGKVAINKISLTTNQACCNLQVNEKIANYKFVYYCLASKYKILKAMGEGSQNNINSNKIKNFKIPVPPIEVQAEIVRILDTFTEPTAELTAELTARKKQYEYYRDLLLTFNGVEFKKLGEIATEIFRGSGITREQVTESGVPCVRYGEIYTTYGIHFDKCISHTTIEKISNPKYFEYGDILFAITGEKVEDIAKSTAYVGNEKCLAGGDIVVLKHNQNPKYLSYALATADAIRQKTKGKIKSKVVHSSVPAIKQIKIPLPPIEEQERIVKILDRFDKLCNDISEGLPAEISARQKQYEYYRDKLLMFDTRQNGRIGDNAIR